MSTLYLVRHGQASFGKEDYDQLSELGYQQAKITGEYLAKITAPSIFVSGSLKRQKQTLQEIKKGFSDQINQTAKSLELDAFNEFDHRNILEVVHPKLKETHADMLASVTTCEIALKEFLQLYKAAIYRWVKNEGDFKENFSIFTHRIETGLKSLMSLLNAKQGQDIILVSSAGPISSCMQFGTDMSAENAFSLCDVMVNTAISSLKFDEDLSPVMSYFNNFQHLVNAESEVTYR
jgi:broad specificity phosphatase PhoE